MSTDSLPRREYLQPIILRTPPDPDNEIPCLRSARFFADWTTNEGVSLVREHVASGTTQPIAVPLWSVSERGKVEPSPYFEPERISGYSTPDLLDLSGAHGSALTLPDNPWVWARAQLFAPGEDDERMYRVHLRTGATMDLWGLWGDVEDDTPEEPEFRGRLAFSGRWVTIKRNAIAARITL